MVDWAMGKFTYTVNQDSIHKRYEQHISTTTKLPEIDNNSYLAWWLERSASFRYAHSSVRRLIDLKTQILLFMNIFVAIADGVFLYKKKLFSPLFFIAVFIIDTD